MIETDFEEPTTHFKIPVSKAQVKKNDKCIDDGDIDIADIAGLTGLCGAPNHLEFPDTTGFDPETHSGVVTFKLLDTVFFDKNEISDKQNDLYVKISLGGHSEKADCRTRKSKLGCHGKIMLNRTHEEQYAELRIKDNQRVAAADIIGLAKINLEETEQKRRLLKWYPLKRDGKTIGEVLMDINYQKYESDY